MDEAQPNSGGPQKIDRRTFASRLGFCAMAGGLATSYGTFAWFAGRYLFPASAQPKKWMFVADLKSLEGVTSLPFLAPNGARINIARLDNKGTVEDFIALSSRCPHLGCHVHWEAQNQRFFCPCHNGTFDSLGKGTGGPPGEAKQSLPRYPLKIEGGLLYIEVPAETLSTKRNETPGLARALPPQEA
jgi:Rieske Fe-S protein